MQKNCILVQVQGKRMVDLFQERKGDLSKKKMKKQLLKSILMVCEY